MGIDDFMQEKAIEENQINVLEYLLSTEQIDLEPASDGIARKIVAEKSLDLSEKQMKTFKDYILPKLLFECSACNCTITDLEDIRMLDENSGRCSSCEHNYRRIVLEE